MMNHKQQMHQKMQNVKMIKQYHQIKQHVKKQLLIVHHIQIIYIYLIIMINIQKKKAKTILIYNYNLSKEKFQYINKTIQTIVSKICYKFEENYDDDCVKYIMISSISRKHFEPIMRKYLNNII